MKLLKIFSDKNFQNVCLNEHFNVVLAKTQDKVSKTDTHGLGKTSLIRVIDFLLLGRFDAKKGLLSNKIFYGQTFYLEIKLNDEQYLVIKRSINTPTLISFKLNNVALADFTPPQSWDNIDLTFDKAKEKLNEYLNFDILTKWDYRKSITYFLRTQQDYLDVYQLGKFSKGGRHLQWKPFVFELLGFNGSLIEKKLLLEQEATDLKNKIKTLEQEANVNIEEKDKILGLIDIKEQEKKEAEQTIDKFNFFFKDNAITRAIIESLDFRIQTLNTEKYRISYELSKVEESLRNTDSKIDVGRLKELFNDVQLYFPNELVKQYDELEKFNTAISAERRKYLRESLQELRIELQTTDTELQSLEKSKSEKLSFLTEKDTYAKFKEYQKQLSVLEADLAILKEKLNWIDKSVKIESEIKTINEKIEDSITDISEAIKQRNHAEISKIFNEIINEIVNRNALISIKQNTLGNVEFSADYVDTNDKNSTSEGDGTSYKKLLCMAFDLSLLIHYHRNSFFRFVYHDGIMEGFDDRIKVRLLDKIKSICSEYNIQHIISLIDSDIPTQNDGSLYPFDDNEICLELNDLDNNGKLFKQSF